MRKEEFIFESMDHLTGNCISVVLEKDENSIYTYLLGNDRKIIQSCYLGYLKEIKEDDFDFSYFMENNLPPPLTRKGSTQYSHLPNIRNAKISVDWSLASMIVVKINDVPYQFFLKKVGEKFGYAKSLGLKGVYGNPWSDDKYKNGKPDPLVKTTYYCCPKHNNIVLFIETRDLSKSNFEIPIHEDPEMCIECLREKNSTYSYLKSECKIKRA